MKQRKNDRIEVSGLVGDYNWRTASQYLIRELSRCESESDFLRFINALLRSVGTGDELNKVRQKLGIHPLKKEDLEIMRDGGKR